MIRSSAAHSDEMALIHLSLLSWVSLIGSETAFSLYSRERLKPTAKAVLGNFRDLLVALWGGIQLTHDPYSLKSSGQIELYAETYADVGVLQPASFVVGDAATTHAGSI